MTYRGQILGGVVVLEGACSIPEGTEVTVEVAEKPQANVPTPQEGTTLGQRLMKFAGMMKGSDLPTDGARNHDHYIYGTPKR